ncbi:putative RDD family membrane protein YckC [Nocardiopsis arvandica]|uniref:Putative RDD family membrane protein YckC n=1 Tax=Nocardiopsis sinuspersici TaxID=501010 RepID=A0A7Y9XBE3_9ACTN|nr:RDD family protein [Nocardiopsis sinuspersici]NYH51715.1 putative RDD family membrane protein YckC [Nocardiopsis sinuspersici]
MLVSYPGNGDARDDVYGVTPLVTGDAVVLDLRPAGFATRAAALAIDAILQIIALIALGVLVSWIGRNLDPAITAAVSLAGTVLVLVGYPTVFETVSRGRSLGKMALGLRVVGTDGSPERFRQALGRALASFVEIWMTTGVIALITSMINRDGRRVGDFVAGTMVVEERAGRRHEENVPMPPQLAGWATGVELSRLSPETVAAARQYVLRYGELAEHTRHEMGVRLANAVASQISPPPPPGVTPPYFLAAVIAERRRRHEAAAAQQAGHPRSGYGAQPHQWGPGNPYS